MPPWRTKWKIWKTRNCTLGESLLGARGKLLSVGVMPGTTAHWFTDLEPDICSHLSPMPAFLKWFARTYCSPRKVLLRCFLHLLLMRSRLENSVQTPRRLLSRRVCLPVASKQPQCPIRGKATGRPTNLSKVCQKICSVRTNCLEQVCRDITKNQVRLGCLASQEFSPYRDICGM